MFMEREREKTLWLMPDGRFHENWSWRVVTPQLLGCDSPEKTWWKNGLWPLVKRNFISARYKKELGQYNNEILPILKDIDYRNIDDFETAITTIFFNLKSKNLAVATCRNYKIILTNMCSTANDYWSFNFYFLINNWFTIVVCSMIGVS